MKNGNERVKVQRPGGGTTYMSRKAAETLRGDGIRIVEDTMAQIPELDEVPAPKRGRPSNQSKA